MLPSERFAILIFLGGIALVYVCEFSVLLKILFRKLRGSEWRAGKWTYALHGMSILGILCISYGYFIEPYWIEVAAVEIKTDKLSRTSLRIVHFSDTHCDRRLRNEREVVERINALKPDIIVFTGDTLNVREALPRFREMMASLQATMGKYAVRGNFDVCYWQDLKVFKNTGFTVLDKDSVHLRKNGESIRIAGLSCAYTNGHKAVLAPLPHESYNVFLYHVPDLAEDIGDLPVDLYLAGHTHGGQVALPFYGALATLSKHGKKYESGRYDIGSAVLYINRGIGMEGGPIPRVRFWARPEITILDIVPRK